MDYWVKQTSTSPLFPDIEWDKPERKDQSGRLLIIGGNLHGFAAPAKAFEYTTEQGIGYIRIALPDALRSTLHAYWTDAVFCPSTPSGSFARDAKEIILNNALWADGILLPGDLGRNSETAIMLEEILSNISSTIAITKDALDYYLAKPSELLDRSNTIIVASFSQLQKMFMNTRPRLPLTYTMSLIRLVEFLHETTINKQLTIITKFEDLYIVADCGSISTTQLGQQKEIWRLETASKAIVSALHNPTKRFEALTHSITL
jgi:hypothetical protein